LESTIVDLRNPRKPAVLRPGAITIGDLERVLGQSVSTANVRVPHSRSHGQIAPGLLPRHYSPRTALVLHPTLSSVGRRFDPNDAYVFLRRPAFASGKNVFWLDPRGDLKGAARQLFATLRKLDALKFKRIHIELAPASGLGHAINDRLKRAAAR
jgi:L-threonylcarbamoyladenylate synthase